MYAFFKNFFSFLDAPEVKDHEYISLGSIFHLQGTFRHELGIFPGVRQGELIRARGKNRKIHIFLSFFNFFEIFLWNNKVDAWGQTPEWF